MQPTRGAAGVNNVNALVFSYFTIIPTVKAIYTHAITELFLVY